MKHFALTLVAIICSVAMIASCATSAVGKAVQTADIQKQLVERSTIEFIKLKKSGDPRITDAVYAQARKVYEDWAVAQSNVAQALSSWKVVKNEPNEQRLMTALNEVVKNVDAYLAIVGRFVDLEKLKNTISQVHPAPVRDTASWSNVELAHLHARLAN